MKPALTEYREWLENLEQTRRLGLVLDRRWNLIRSGLFLAAIGLLLLGYRLVPHAGLVTLGWLSGIAFLVAVTLHENLRDRFHAERLRRGVVKRLIARGERRWDRLPLWNPKLNQADDRGGDSPDIAAVADDLDVFGQGSLFQLVSLASLGPGLRTLADWLIGPARQETASRRHAAAQRLAPLRSWRVDFYTHARRAADGTADPDHFLRWIQSPSWLQRHPLLSAWSRLSPLILVGLLVVLFAAVVAARGADPEAGSASEMLIRWFGIAIAAVVGINLWISTFLLGDVHDIFASALSGRGDVEGYRRMFELCESLPSGEPEPGPSGLGKSETRQSTPVSGDLIDHAKRTLCDPTHGASGAMKSLGWVAVAASLKHGGGLFLVYLLLQMGGLWDLHVLRRLERWQQRYSSDAASWFDALGELEAAASLAALIDENPDWATPTWVTGKALLSAEQLGHPLLGDGQRVCNDVAVGPRGTLLLVTGSNMSGKSTLLRSVGLNVLLAGAGGPVCARSFSLPDLELATSIRVRDNLGEGVSFYMAELQSLARVVRHAEALAAKRAGLVTDVAAGSAPAPPPTLLYLLDEILQGTNSRERQIAVAHVLRHLIDHGAIGAISTHDLELADDPGLRAIAHTVHFRETITKDDQGRDQMSFDYQMREGVSPTTNALRLLEIVGLGIPADGAPSA